jgi:hypothetical protein
MCIRAKREAFMILDDFQLRRNGWELWLRCCGRDKQSQRRRKYYPSAHLAQDGARAAAPFDRVTLSINCQKQTI